MVDLNLRLPSMLHGKKPFERLESAFQNVLNSSMAWLFCDLESSSSQDDSMNHWHTRTSRNPFTNFQCSRTANQKAWPPAPRLRTTEDDIWPSPGTATKWTTVERDVGGRAPREYRSSLRMDCHGTAWIAPCIR